MRILHVVGARPNFMKIAPIMQIMSKYPEVFKQTLVHTGQHYDTAMSKVFFDDLQLPEPDVYLGVGSDTHAQQTACIMSAFEPILLEQKTDWMFVVGDVNSTLACALVAAKTGIRTAHVEAGLRSFDRTMPEEINRLLTDQISDLLFVTEPSGLINLSREGCPQHKIHFVGNVMIDTLLYFQDRAEQSPILESLGISSRGYMILTLHRPSNVDHRETFENILKALVEIGQHVPILFPIHPRTLKLLSNFKLLNYFVKSNPSESPIIRKGIHLMDPLGYLDFCKLLANAKAVLTDSGGIQEETTWLGIPCLTLRENTERPITVTEGTNIIVGRNPKKIVAECLNILGGGGKKGNIPMLWDGRAAQRIVDVLMKT